MILWIDDLPTIAIAHAGVMQPCRELWLELAVGNTRFRWLIGLWLIGSRLIRVERGLCVASTGAMGLWGYGASVVLFSELVLQCFSPWLIG